ncbi:hypothetical protein BaRGS_00009006, partial [Batillaria attramentaria]
RTCFGDLIRIIEDLCCSCEPLAVSTGLWRSWCYRQFKEGNDGSRGQSHTNDHKREVWKAMVYSDKLMNSLRKSECISDLVELNAIGKCIQVQLVCALTATFLRSNPKPVDSDVEFIY